MALINFVLIYTDYRENFHAVVDTLSDVKQPAKSGQSRVSSYFDGYVIDRTARIRFVCFNSQKHAAIARLAESGEALAFGNVLMKKNRVTKAMEAHVQDSTSFMRSPKKIDLPNHLHANTSVPKKISISDVDKQAPDQLITVDAKVVELSAPPTMPSGSRACSTIKRVVVGDQSGCCILTLWNDFTDAVELDRSYTFQSMGHHRSGKCAISTRRNEMPPSCRAPTSQTCRLKRSLFRRRRPLSKRSWSREFPTTQSIPFAQPAPLAASTTTLMPEQVAVCRAAP